MVQIDNRFTEKNITLAIIYWAFVFAAEKGVKLKLPVDATGTPDALL